MRTDEVIPNEKRRWKTLWGTTKTSLKRPFRPIVRRLRRRLIHELTESFQEIIKLEIRHLNSPIENSQNKLLLDLNHVVQQTNHLVNLITNEVVSSQNKLLLDLNHVVQQTNHLVNLITNEVVSSQNKLLLDSDHVVQQTNHLVNLITNEVVSSQNKLLLDSDHVVQQTNHLVGMVGYYGNEQNLNYISLVQQIQSETLQIEGKVFSLSERIVDEEALVDFLESVSQNPNISSL